MNNTSSMSTDAVSLCAYAKINIHLKVLAKREDGFHNLESIFQRISIADYLSITRSNDLHGCTVESPLLPLPAENTLTKAWTVFSGATGIDTGIAVRLIKNLPAGSGLGAGSSDAAALLKAVNELFAMPLSNAELTELALQVGSDVPFFLSGNAGVVTGRGEVFKPLQARTDCFGILIWPDVQSSTKEAYLLLDDQKKEPFDEPDAWGYEKLSEQYHAPFKAWQFVNDFQPMLEQRYPVISRVCTDFYEQGAEFAQMSGSGSAVFGLFRSERLMTSAFQVLAKRWSWCKPFLLLA
ncbi:4-(cytidine 5'-diphospho)-2-C-methyl-D-erythritol kinase [Treponema vincentii]|uniref:4-(cytidine 5'-diphospho)-2-C-methyl-D-erythritol kinase n=1 Tax=Treponema vincentii TaxID=69710 RepID=UPI0020A40A0A|nr:4-(cytidine 5'-diphospho)-2-C-methyl-D-erythritol kinase [Treponema vincentii]UTC46008.1 4-(cytidine 5'-diphospho)-2-C-methyl-D-erythritol kinase [Treponema vincentii]